MYRELKVPSEYISINKVLILERDGVRWDMSMTDLAGGQGLSVALSDSDNPGHYNKFYLDYSKIMDEPTAARIHMMPGADKRVSFEEKLVRMELWAKAIIAFDSLMTQEINRKLKKNQVEEMVSNSQLPRVEISVADTGNDSLIRLFKGFQYPQNEQPPYPFMIPWADLVAKARSGELVAAWRAQKGK